MTYTDIRYYCPHCSKEHFKEDETEIGIYCSCGFDYWLSECITEEKEL